MALGTVSFWAGALILEKVVLIFRFENGNVHHSKMNYYKNYTYAYFGMENIKNGKRQGSVLEKLI